MRVSEKGGASSSRLVSADRICDGRSLAIVEAGGQDVDRLNVAPDLTIEESDDHELDEEVLTKFVEEVGGGDSSIDHTSPARIVPRGPGLSCDLFPRSSDDIASSSSYETIERLRGDEDWSCIDIRILRPLERPWSPPEGFLCLYECYFSHGGMWFPIPKLVLEYCEARRVAPSQLTCASYRNICAILTMAAELGRSVNLAQLEEMVGIAKSGDCDRFYASMRCILPDRRVEEIRSTEVGNFIEQRIKRCRLRVTTGDFAIPLAKIRPYTHKPLKDRKQQSSKKQRSEAEDMGIEDLDVIVYSVGSGSAKAPMSSDARRKDKGIVIENPSKNKIGVAAPTKPAETSKVVGDLEAGRSEKRKDQEGDRRHSGSDPKRSKKEKRKDKALVVSEAANIERPNPEERNAEELVGDQTAVGTTLSFGDDYDFSLQFSGRGRHILEDPIACGEYVRCIQGHPRGPVPESEEMVERDEFLAFSVDLTRMVSNVNFMWTRYERMLQKNHELIVENRSLKSRMKNMTNAAEERVGRILALEQKNEELKVEVAKWEDEYGVEKVGTELQERVEAKFEKIRRHIADSKKMNHISSTVGQIKAFLSFYEEQGSAPDGAVERLQEDLEKYLKMVVAQHVEKISEEDFTFPDRASWIPGEELVFPVETPHRIGQYGLGEEWDSTGEEEVRSDGEVDPRPSRVTLRVGGTDPIVSPRGRERRNGSGSSHVSETDEDEGPMVVDGRTENVEHPPEVAGASNKAAEGPSTVADPAGGPNVTTEVPGIDDIDVVNF
ncbi:hypothetical protein AALP_AAs73729U000100 [Arabis alpina]|uniref:DUF1204 domain-containing protein n=1 Tax=Arabis alpina TaxID=50452 RepID=A0A087G111_ARAAL|nr:hypothetical protein AALP_AAs73729U000100 [Arabis alpina]